MMKYRKVSGLRKEGGLEVEKTHLGKWLREVFKAAR